MMTAPHKVDDCPQELADAIREFFPPEEWDNAASISFLESGWRWDALDDTTTLEAPCGAPLYTREGERVTAERSIGFFQINSCNHPDWIPGTLYNTRQNVGTAHQLWAGSGWAPWYFSAAELGLL